METSNRGRHITRPDPLHDVALISVATTPFRVVISAVSTPTVSVGASRNHVHDSSAMRTLLAHLSYLLGFNIRKLVLLHWHSVFANTHSFSMVRQLLSL